jgi:hypothetical protein
VPTQPHVIPRLFPVAERTRTVTTSNGSSQRPTSTVFMSAIGSPLRSSSGCRCADCCSSG